MTRYTEMDYIALQACIGFMECIRNVACKWPVDYTNSMTHKCILDYIGILAHSISVDYT